MTDDYGLFFALFCSLAVIGVVAHLFFYEGTNVALKRKLWPVYIIFAGAMLIGLAWTVLGLNWKLAIPIVSVSFIAVTNIRSVLFCEPCGALVRSATVVDRPTMCARCEAPTGEIMTESLVDPQSV